MASTIVATLPSATKQNKQIRESKKNHFDKSLKFKKRKIRKKKTRSISFAEGRYKKI